MKKAWICLLLVNVISVSSMNNKKGIINNPYHDRINEVQLQPIYKPRPQEITQQQKKSLLKTNSFQRNEKIQQSLYDTVYKITLDTYENKINQDQQIGRFIRVIEQINNAKENGIDEDRMGQFAYNKSRDYIFMSRHIPLVFSLLKRYNYTINDTKEEIPYKIAHYYNKKLSRMFGIESSENNQVEPSTFEDLLKPYPAYVQLTNKLNELLCISFNKTLGDLTVYLYENKDILFSGYSDDSYTNLLDDFYTKAYLLFFKKGSCIDLYKALLMIDKAKQLGDINKETDLGYGILNFDPIQSSISKKLLKTLQKQELTNKGYIINTKNRIALFCKLIEQYNNTDINKKKPTPRQYFCYEKQKELNLILPSSSTSLDENCYAFTAFQQLKDNFVALGNTTNRQEIELWVNKVYPNK
jgi:hypothetical protein